MKKYLAILRSKKVLDLFIVQMRFRNINYEHVKGLQYNIYTDDKIAKELNDRFDWIAVIKTEL